MNKDLHFWTVKHWMNRPGQNYKAFSIWASPTFIIAAKKAMETFNQNSCQAHAKALIEEAMPGRSDVYREPLTFRKEVGLAHIDVPGNACGLDLDFKSEGIYKKGGYTLLPHNIDTTDQQSTLFTIWLWWAKAVETYVE